MPGTWNKAITNSGLNNGLITGQGQKAVVTGRGDNNIAPTPYDADEVEFQRLFSLLKEGISVDESIQNTNSPGLIIVGQGQSVRVHGVETNSNTNTEAPQTSQDTVAQQRVEETMTLR